jgi:hypothetical protein
MDMFWSIFSMPLGVFLFFGPALVVWFLTGRKDSGANKSSDRR